MSISFASLGHPTVWQEVHELSYQAVITHEITKIKSHLSLEHWLEKNSADKLWKWIANSRADKLCSERAARFAGAAARIIEDWACASAAKVLGHSYSNCQGIPARAMLPGIVKADPFVSVCDVRDRCRTRLEGVNIAWLTELSRFGTAHLTNPCLATASSENAAPTPAGMARLQRAMSSESCFLGEPRS